MIIVTQDVETRLLKDVMRLQKTMPHLRCIHLRIAPFRQKLPDDFLIRLISALRETWQNEECHMLFKCADGDIFILAAQPVMRKSLTRLFSHTSLCFLSAPFGESAGIFVLESDGDYVLQLIEEKIGRIRDTVKRRVDAETAERRRAALQVTATPVYVETIDVRRQNRTEPAALLVEDDAFIQRLVENVMKHTLKLSLAQNARSAIASYPELAPDIVFLDIGLPDASGHDVLQKILEIDPEAYIVMLSGNHDMKNVKQAIACGAKGFIVKPFTKARMHAYLQKSPHLRDKLSSRQFFDYPLN